MLISSRIPPPPLAPPDQLPRLPHHPPTSSAATFQLCAKAKTSQLLRQLFNLARGGAQKEGAVSSGVGGGTEEEGKGVAGGGEYFVLSAVS